MKSLSRRHFLTSSLAGMVAAQAVQGQPLEIAIAPFQVEVTPPKGHPCMGGGIAPISEIDDPLYLMGVIITGVGKPIVLAAIDWCEIRNDAYDAWRDELAQAVSTDRNRIMLTSVHQHDAPISDLTAQKLLESIKAHGAICDLEFHAQVIAKAARAAQQALKSPQKVTHIGMGQAEVKEVASNRRYIDEAGRVRHDRTSFTSNLKIREAPEGRIDPFLKTLSFWNEETPLLALSAYACHPMSTYGRGRASADFPGIARKLRQSDNPKLVQIYMSGCSGNVTAGKYNSGPPENREILGKRLHAAMKAAWEKTKKIPLSQATFRCETLKLEAREDSGYDEASLKKRLTDDSKGFGKCLAAMGLSWRKRVSSGQGIDVPVLDFGSAVILILPAESYVEYQLTAQQLRKDDFVLVAGYGECGPGYIPHEQAWEEQDGNLSDWCWVKKGSESAMQEVIKKALLKK